MIFNFCEYFFQYGFTVVNDLKNISNCSVRRTTEIKNRPEKVVNTIRQKNTEFIPTYVLTVTTPFIL